MAFSMKLSLVLFFTCSLFVQGTLAEVLCEKLPSNLCAFAIASSGKRCILETYRNELGDVDFICKTTEVVVERMAGHIESDQCINACGVEREFIGISTDSFLSSEFTAHLCSSACYHNCPNVIDLFFNLAAGEGVSLPALCEQQKENHRAMLTLLSSDGGVAPGPVAAPLAAPIHY